MGRKSRGDGTTAGNFNGTKTLTQAVYLKDMRIHTHKGKLPDGDIFDR